MSPADRFQARVRQDGECWLWTGATDPNGYGRFFLNRKMRHAHRVAFEWFKGPVPAGLDLDHLCRRRNCVWPLHLEAVTRRENLMRGETLTAAHAARRDCGFERCISCRRFRQVAS